MRTCVSGVTKRKSEIFFAIKNKVSKDIKFILIQFLKKIWILWKASYWICIQLCQKQMYENSEKLWCFVKKRVIVELKEEYIPLQEVMKLDQWVGHRYKITLPRSHWDDRHNSAHPAAVNSGLASVTCDPLQLTLPQKIWEIKIVKKTQILLNIDQFCEYSSKIKLWEFSKQTVKCEKASEALSSWVGSRSRCQIFQCYPTA